MRFGGTWVRARARVGSMLSRGQPQGPWSLVFTNGARPISHLKVHGRSLLRAPGSVVRGPYLISCVLDVWEGETLWRGSELWVSVSHSSVQMAQEISSFVYNCSLSLCVLYLKS